MHSLRHIKGALKPGLRGRKRLIITAIAAVVSFATGALLPEERVLAGAAVAAVAVALLQVIFAIIDGQGSGKPPADDFGDPADAPDYPDGS